MLEKHCSLCHGTELVGGAPFSLVTHGDFHEKAADEPRYERVKARLHDEKNPMPPIDHARLSAAELELLDTWLDDKAPAGTEVCEKGEVKEPPEEVDLSDCEELFELRANDGTKDGETQAFEVPLADDHYECFVFDVPWTGAMQGLRVDPLIDDARVLHHWLLYQDPVASAGEAGSHSSCLGVHTDGTLVAGWAPGGSAYVMPENVGLRLESSPSHVFVLEMHYNNVARHEDAKDKSGARLCVTSKLRENEAAAHWLGTDIIALRPQSDGKAEGVCRPEQEAHILSVSPHMHQLGRHMSTLITRADGTEETLFDDAFDFNDQRVYTLDEPVVVGPGDTLRTKCSFSNESSEFVLFGSGTGDEMCYNFVVAYPVGALATGGSFLGGANKCMK